jgi:integrase
VVLPAVRDIELQDAIQRIALRFPAAYGRPRISAELKRQGFQVNHKRVGRILREDNLLCLRKKNFHVTTNSKHGFTVYPNLTRNFVPTARNQLWVADITYIRLAEEFVYLAVVLDAYSRLLTQYIGHLKAQKKPSAYVIEKCVNAHIRPFFGAKKVARLQTTDFERYREMRTSGVGAVSNATVDHDFTYWKAALSLEYKKTPSRVIKVPHIPKSGEDNVRQGFLEFDGYEKVLAAVPVSLKGLFVVGYHVGNRKGALLDLKWSQVDFKHKVIRFIRVQNHKSAPVAAPIYGDMVEWLRKQKAFRDEHFPNSEFVFYWYPVDCEIAPESKKGHGGRRGTPGAPIKSFYDSWRSAVALAGVPDLLFHDLRRSAVRNMVEKIKMSEKRAMVISGHITRSCFDRYHIVSLDDIQESGEKMDRWVREQRSQKEE